MRGTHQSAEEWIEQFDEAFPEIATKIRAREAELAVMPLSELQARAKSEHLALSVLQRREAQKGGADDLASRGRGDG